MSVLREENTSREDYIQQCRGKTQKVDPEIETKISGLLNCSNFIINESEADKGVQSLLKSVLMFCQMCNSA